MPPVEWFLEINGHKTGPYPSEQLLGLFKEGEIPAEARVTAEHLQGEWITVEKLAQFSSRIPDRPEMAMAPKAEKPHKPDPSQELFETVKKVQKPQSPGLRPATARGTPSAALSPSEPTESAVDWRKWAPRAGLGLGLAAIGALSFWGILRLMKSDPQKTPPPSPADGSSQISRPAPGPEVTYPMNRFGGKREAVPPPTTESSQPEFGARLPRPQEAKPTQHTDPLELFPRPPEPREEARDEPPPIYPNEPPALEPLPPLPAPNDPETGNGGDGAT